MNIQGRLLQTASLGAFAVLAAMAGCSAGGKQQSSSSTPTVTDLVVSSSKTSIQDTGSDTATITVTAVDSNRNALASVPVTVVPDSNGVYSTTSSTTSATGQVSGTLSIGGDKSNRTIDLVVTSGSIRKTIQVAVTGATLQATPSSATPGGSATVQYHLVDSNSADIAGQAITITSDSLPTVAGTTDANGKFTYTYTAPNAASVTINASSGGATSTNTVTLSASSTPPASATPTSSSISANPTSVAINPAGSTSNQVDVRALFLAAGNAPVSNVRVRFDLDGDPNGIGGTLTSGTGYVYSDSNGVARTTFIPGSRASGSNAVIIRACWSTTDIDAGQCPNATPLTTNVTVVNTGVSLSIFNNGKIVEDDVKEVYTIDFAVQVVDSAGNPVQGAAVSKLAYIPRYYRGGWQTLGGTYQQTLLNSCDNEDVNRNNVLEVYSNGDAEDANASGKLEPYAADITIVNTSTGSDVTDAFGKAYFTLQYGQNVASWDDYQLTFSVVVSGTEGQAVTSGHLPIPNDVYAAAAAGTTTPPWELSPYNLTPANAASILAVGTTTVVDPATSNSGVLCQKQP